MLTERFSKLFGRLLSRWIVYQDAPRDPSRVAELGAARISLDDVRSEIAEERRHLVAAAPQKEGLRVAVSPAELDRLRVASIGFDVNA